jgi:tRNA dimethylallyltransferase
VGTLSQDYPLLAIVGPTAAGKSSLALALAERWNGEIINCDSVQIYRRFDIGTGKVPPCERRGIPHHLLDVADPEELFTAGDYRRHAIPVLHDIRGRGRLPIIVGGTGLYLRALLLGLFEGPPRSEALRGRLRALGARRGRDFLHRMLRRLDAKAAERIHPRDTPKTIRALEVCILARQPLTTLHERGREGLRGFRVLRAGLNPNRPQLARRIDERVAAMFQAGLLDEVRGILSRGDADRIKALGAIGYREARAVLAGEMRLDDAIRATQTATRQYAKRQMTWFRREEQIEWFAGFGDDPNIQQSVSAWLEERLPARPDGLEPRGNGRPAPELFDGENP